MPPRSAVTLTPDEVEIVLTALGARQRQQSQFANRTKDVGLREACLLTADQMRDLGESIVARAFPTIVSRPRSL